LSVTVGTRIGLYEILSTLGTGGMGEVYRARDTKLNRDVAIKVLLPAVSNDPDRLARFSREAQVLASLNHSNIAAIYGIEESNGVTALVMELVEGEDLSQRISRGPISIEEALPIARQIAEALEAAHDCGIIHRDLKPANVKVRPDGTVKVLDFGLAKAVDPSGGSSAAAMNSPTLSVHATQAGIILGTAAYMSPEQARGTVVDKRADVWAFGVVLFEMLTGQRPFEGDTLSDTLASILKTEPPWDLLPANVPATVRRLLTICLKKDAKVRLRDIGEARRQIDDALAGGVDVLAAVAVARSPIARQRPMLPWAIAGVLAIALASLLLAGSPWRPAPSQSSRALLTYLGTDASLPTEQGAAAILSPDGTTLAFTAQADQRRLFVRKLDQLQATALNGTEGATNPFFSPDGQWIAFFADGKLKRVSVAGGAPVTLSAAPDNRGGTWAEDDTIIFAPSRTTLERVSSAGGASVPFGTVGERVSAQRWPQALPGGHTVLYSERYETSGFDSANVVVAPVMGGPAKVVVEGGYYGRYLPSGHLIYVQQGSLFAVPFDLAKLETVGRAVPALDNFVANPATGGAQYAFSLDGSFVYLPGKAFTGERRIDWMSRDGKPTVLRAALSDWRQPRFSPDGQKLAIAISDGTQNDIWIYQWAGDTLTQLTFDPADDGEPVWTADSRRIVFASDRARRGIPNLYSANADGSGAVSRLTDTAETQNSASSHPSGGFFAFSAGRPATGLDLMILPMNGDAVHGWSPGTPTEFLSTAAMERDPMFSPDGRWIAYTSNESGQDDIYVRPFQGPGGPWRISTQGGQYPRWSSAANELLFLDGLKVMSVSYSTPDGSFQPGKPQSWTTTTLVGTGASPYDLHPDGKRIATTAAVEEGVQKRDHLVFILDFFDYLRRIAPVAKP
jgi:serine/threonine protein kinase/Tol biopolymer transport system component